MHCGVTAPSRVGTNLEPKGFWVLLKVWQCLLCTEAGNRAHAEQGKADGVCQEWERGQLWACMKPREGRSPKVPQEEGGIIWPAERLAEPWEGAESPEICQRLMEPIEGSILGGAGAPVGQAEHGEICSWLRMWTRAQPSRASRAPGREQGPHCSVETPSDPSVEGAGVCVMPWKVLQSS